MAYTFVTLAQAQADLAARLYDPNTQFWSAAELTAYLTEALRTFNSYTNFHRAEFSFPLTQGVHWYDIPSQSGSLRPYSVLDSAILQMIEYHLLEPITTYPLVWTGSTQFGFNDILANMTQAQNQILSATGATVTRGLVNAPIVKQRITLADTTLDIRRVAWLPLTGTGFVNTPLRQSDMWQKRAYDIGWTISAQAPPNTWMQSTEPPPSFDVDRVPPVTGNYEVLSVQSGATFNSVAAQFLSIPDDWSWLIKWGAMENLFGREGVAKDAPREDYCQKRFAEGIKLLNGAAAVLALQLDGIPLYVDSVRNGDDFNPLWQAASQGTPSACYAASLNLIGFPAPDAGPHSALLSVVQNAVVPTAAGDYLQIPRDEYNTILDYAQHLAAFKQGGEEFLITLPLYQNFRDRCSLYNSKLKQMGQFTLPTYEISQIEQERNPRLDPGVLSHG